jgi:hypothetical protein
MSGASGESDRQSRDGAEWYTCNRGTPAKFGSDETGQGKSHREDFSHSADLCSKISQPLLLPQGDLCAKFEQLSAHFSLL